MQPVQRKFFMNERSVPKQSKNYYQKTFITQKQISPISPYYAQHPTKNQLALINLDAPRQYPKQEHFKTLNLRRKNEGQMNNLKSELQNLKNQVNKLISKEPSIQTVKKQTYSTIEEQPNNKKINYVTKDFGNQIPDREEDFSDTTSMNSVTTEKILNQPLRRLQSKANSQNYDQAYYMQLENDLLKNQIRSLKNKYVSKKRQLTEKCDLLQKKNQYLEINLQKSEESLIECRRTLETEIAIIKKQISMKNDFKKQLHRPETDKPEFQTQSNDFLQEKLKKTYEEMNQKTKHLNNLSIQIEDLESMLEKNKFDLKKETQKNIELSKQLELAKRESSRLQLLVETQTSKKKDLIKQNESLKRKNKQLAEDNYKKEQIVVGSEQYENRMAEEIQFYQKREDDLQAKLLSFADQNKKLKQLVSTNNEEIAYLKKSNQESTTRITQLTRKIKDEQNNALERQQNYRNLIEETKQKEKEKIALLKEQLEIQKSQEEYIHKEQSQSASELLRQKQRQISKWKAQYKMLKLNQDEKKHSDVLTIQESEHYYQGFKQYKHKSEILEQKNRLLEASLNTYIKKFTDYQSQCMRNEVDYNKAANQMKNQITKLKNEIANYEEDLTLAKNQILEITAKNEEQTQYRQELQSKIESFIGKNLQSESSDDQDQNSNQDNQKHIDSLRPQKKSSNYKEQSPQKNTKIRKSQIYSKIKQPELNQSQKLQLEELTESIATIKKRVIQQDQKLAKNARQIKNKDNLINKLKKEIRDLLETHEKELMQIKQKLISEKVEFTIKSHDDSQKQIKQFYQKQVQVFKAKYEEAVGENVQLNKKVASIEKELLQLRQENKFISNLYNCKCSELEKLTEKTFQELTLRQKKIDELQLIKQHNEKNLLNQIQNLKDEIYALRLEIKNQLLIKNKFETGNFDEALRNQIETSNTLRQQLIKKNEEISKFRDNYTLTRSQYDNLRSEAEVQKLKSLSERKNIEVQYQIEVQNLKNKLDTQQKKMCFLEQKIALVIEENKKKDSFIQSYIMGKKLPQADKQFIIQFVKQYEFALDGKTINQKFKSDAQEIEKLTSENYKLLKELAQLNSKLLLYQQMEGENFLVNDSKLNQQFDRKNDQK